MGKDEIIKIIKDIEKGERPLGRGGKKLRARDMMIEALANYNFKTVLDIGSGGPNCHNAVFRKCGKEVHTNDMCEKYNPTYLGNFLDIAHTIPDNNYDAVWCSHTLEHQLNPGLFLQTMKRKLKEGGLLMLTVPPMKHYIVAGHVNHWTTGMLLLILVMVGFDCSEAVIKAPKPEKFDATFVPGNINPKLRGTGATSIDPYDISILVPKKDIGWSNKKWKEMDRNYRKTHGADWGIGDADVFDECLYLSGAGLQVLKQYFPKNIEWIKKGEKDQQFDGRIGDK